MNETLLDAVIVGAGQAGGPLAGALARAGWRVAVIEREHVGGTCINEGCTPTKTMIASARVAHVARRASDYGVSTGAVSVSLERVRQRKREIVDSFRDGSQGKLEAQPGVELIFGEARFVAPETPGQHPVEHPVEQHSLEVRLRDGGTRRLAAPKVFVNAGARPYVPEIPGLSDVAFLNSTSIMELAAPPEHLIVLGGGYIGFEFAQMFRRFGSRVTVIERAARMLEREDEEVAGAVVEVLRAEGVEFRAGTQVRAVHQTADGSLELELQTGDQTSSLSGSHLLVAIGRSSNADSLDLQAVGVHTDARGFITVNEHLETNVAGIYALGDIKGGPAFTHISYDDYRIVRDALLHDSRRSTKDRLVPYTMFTDPQLARVGLSETQAREQKRAAKVYRLPMSSVARAIETNETAGLMQAVVDAETDLILGATVLGPEGGEIMSVLQMAMIGGVTAGAIREAVFAHPTLSESLNNLFSTTPTTL